MFADLDYPLVETGDEWVVHGFSFANYLAEFGDKAQSEIFAKSSLDRAMRDAFRKMRHFLMTAKRLTEDEAISLMSVAVDFGVTQVVDGNWGVHAIMRKALFTAKRDKGSLAPGCIRMIQCDAPRLVLPRAFSPRTRLRGEGQDPVLPWAPRIEEG